MADIIRVASRKLGAEAEAPPLTPPWFLPGAEAVWQRIAEAERKLRSIVRQVYAMLFGENAAQKIENAIPERERDFLKQRLRSRPPGSDPLTIVDYLYLGQIPGLLFASEVWPQARKYFVNPTEAKQQLNSAIGQIASMRNEIAHIREVNPDRLLRANVACGDIIAMVTSSPVHTKPDIEVA